MIALYKGRRGSGKTTTLVRDAYLFKLRGWKIYSNMSSLSFADRFLSVKEILNLITDDDEDFVIVIDEIQTLINSRRSMRKEAVTFTYFIQQIRKRNVVILAATQYVRRVDVAFREHIDVLVSPRFFEEFPVIEVTYQDLTVLEGYEEDLLRFESVIVYDPRPVFALFDTQEVIYDQNQLLSDNE